VDIDGIMSMLYTKLNYIIQFYLYYLTEGFHPADLARVKNTDDWLKRFLLHSELDVQLALQLLWDSCEWRKKFGTNGM
jgi:hypothetical protein